MTYDYDAVNYGRGAAAIRRRALHERLRELYSAGELATTVSSLYYDGAQSGQWLSDSEHAKVRFAVAAAEGRTIRKPRVPRQNVSDDVQWLIDAELVDPSWVTDFSRDLYDFTGETDLKAAAVREIQHLRLCPWNGVPPLIVVESRSLASALQDAVSVFHGRLAPLAGQAGRSYLRTDVAHRLKPTTPVAYLGDWNPAGSDIEANARQKLATYSGDWCGDRDDELWTRLAVTNADAASGRYLRVSKRDGRRRVGHDEYESIEAEALGTTDLRARLVAWFEGLLPRDFDLDAHESRTSTGQRVLIERIT
jgi:hypothetical protein